MHHHAARQRHYDLRLEHAGVLLSWAVPKGPSPDPADKRLAVRVEDHPLEYVDYEGRIPEGSYGAGPTIVWDAGTWVPLADPDAGLERGKLLFELRGHKLRGRWTLVKTRRGKQDWLLIKERDGAVRAGGTDAYPSASVLSGHTVETLAAGSDLAAPLRAELERLGAPRRRLRRPVTPMLATRLERPFTRAGGIFEIKYDGYRLLAAREDARVALASRRGADLTALFPEVRRAVAALPGDDLILDGEVVVHDEGGRPSFARLQARAQLGREADVARAALERPATLYVLDLLALSGFDLRPLPLVARKRLLRRLLPPVGVLRYSDHVEREGEAMCREVARMGLEGIVAKRADSPYRGGRSRDWLKIVAARTGDFAVAGYTRQAGAALGALLLAERAGDGWVYRGRVGTGFSEAERRALAAELGALAPAAPPAGGPRRRGLHWVDPPFAVEVRYKEVTAAGQLRHPIYVRRRDDKAPRDCVAEAVAPAPRSDEPPPVAAAGGEGRERGLPAVALTNLDKVYWPGPPAHTKGDLVGYYRAIAPWLLPYLRDRPLVLTRYPDGVEGKSFFQHDAPVYAGEHVRLERIWSGHGHREIATFVVDDLEALLYVANLGAIVLHVWASRIGSLESPDWCVLDLDPKEAPFADVVAVARAIAALCADVDLPAYVKSSGSSGLHVHIPLGGQLTHDQSRTLAELLARLVALELPGVATLARRISHRAGKVYLDYGQNGHGRLTVAPFSARPLPGAPVAMPLGWHEVRPGLDIGRYTIASAPRRMRALARDPLAGVLADAPDLARALDALGRRFAARRR